ncbi:EAL domain-containing protein [Marinobacterium sediminicola]|uniref:PAS domain S-box-containing protein/diguanylate cyclase (GGDEF) domain-containing protein n=1 Tax=Marinobacterium sediminicola TaxID=518898 RepID=A0ABY1RWP1_9GAMM|nr:EAL domain-containing protein [Marinobacterium sediminicola]ULG70278.1 EAL domain-containing protein [Marinobacterium sediminicola]SMR69873.1 PAS domain S-box-containing protein/diguanylate cyclase (GGDEF) domain-containing protein [Marinobacterium sediminicola]
MMHRKEWRPLGYVVLYLLFGLIWVHGSDFLISLLAPSVGLFDLINSFKGSAFVVISASCLYLALAPPSDRLVSGEPVVHDRGQWVIFASLMLIALALPSVGGALTLWLEAEKAILADATQAWLLTGLAAMALSALLILIYRRQLNLSLAWHLDSVASQREQLLGRFFDMPFIGMGLTDPTTGHWIKVNDCLECLLGFSVEELRQKTWQELTHPEDLAADESAFRRLLNGDTEAYQLEKRFIAASGQHVPVRIYIKLLRDGSGLPEHVICMIQDLTREQHNQRALQRQSNLYNMLSRINQVILYSRTVDEVLQAACRIAVEEGQLRFAWIGLCDEHRRITGSQAHAGDPATALGVRQLMQIFARHPGQGVSEQAVLNDETVVVNDCLAVAEYQPWHEFASRFRCLSAIALPLHHKGEVYANLTLYSDSVDFFSPKLVKTLEELAHDIGFALDSISRDQALEAANQVINSSPFVLIRWRHEQGWPIEYVSENIRNLGLEPEQLMHRDSRFESFIHPQDRTRVSEEAHRYMQQGVTTFTQTYRLGNKAEDDPCWVEDQTHVLQDPTGKVVAIEGVLTDITTRRQQERRLQQAAAVVQSTREGVLITNANRQVIQVNPAFTDMFGWNEEELSQQSLAVLRSEFHPASFYHALWQQVGEEGHWQGEIMCRRRHGEVFPALLSISRIRLDSEDASHYVSVFTDISRLKNSESRIEYLANHDALTGLPNRKALFRQLEACSHYNRHHERLSALLMADLDNFRDINDSLGHPEGDRLLQQIVERLEEGVREGDLLYRLGGDEFGILLQEVSDSNDVVSTAAALIQRLQPVFRLSDCAEVRASASWGITLIDDQGLSPEVILQQADAALFKAKEQRGSLHFFSDDLTLAVHHRMQLEQRLRRALEHDELCLYYQPQWSIDGSRMTGVEALVRWQDPEKGLISPAEFIPVAEQSALISQIGSWVLRSACEQIARWLVQGIQVPRVAVNVSPQQLHHHHLPQEVASILQQTHIPPTLLELELTESALMSPGVEAVEMLNALRVLGVSLAIDDFGTGYSSLAYLKRFPLNMLKIDKSFTDDLLASDEAKAIVETVVMLGHKLGLSVLAEGVEDERQRVELERLGCHQFQGYLKSRPLPATELEALLVNREI